MALLQSAGDELDRQVSCGQLDGLEGLWATLCIAAEQQHHRLPWRRGMLSSVKETVSFNSPTGCARDCLSSLRCNPTVKASMHGDTLSYSLVTHIHLLLNQVREDAQLRTFFRDMSYSSFKNLADAYVRREMTASRPDVNPQEIQFAFAVHLTARVAGIRNQAVNRIMGFGTRYLEDSFVPYGKILRVRRRTKSGLSFQLQVRARGVVFGLLEDLVGSSYVDLYWAGEWELDPATCCLGCCCGLLSLQLSSGRISS